ncbi:MULTISPECIES: TonB-dependent receptor [unclassified Lysobacter]|uniref:TonB-dependent receptor n=1 Tax=unclassified Lysobacter TaxID=2635362 RepID=UPI0006FA0FE7|nr:MULTISPECIES: TonB-dependent receptor [unclassified Lysobacter]KQZ60044.1 TonB-dependent receptor [Lysobacter sp. Root559]KRC38487.1 TonB-dependent receptor [Lysobacter sp. Root76]KRD71316.1 TonB-dependent receptor [Lysobacter sp. Root96]
MVKPLSAAIGSILLLSVISGQARAQDAETAADSESKDSSAVDLDSVVVTGTRSPKAVDKIPGAITLVSKEEVQRSLVLTEDATAVLARSVPGYAESSQAMSNTGENLRGRVALRLFDGVPQGSPLREGTRNATFTDMGIVGRIEVINGPSASEGIGAAGGIINYLSAAPTKEGNEVTLISRYSTQFGDDSDGWKLGLNFARKDGEFDMLASASIIDRGISYDADGRRVGMNTSGSVADSEARNLFLKAGYNFGADGSQRIEGSVSHFKIEGKANYIQVLGCRPEEFAICGETRTNTSEPGQIFGSKAAFNDFKQYQLTYSHFDLGGGTLLVNAYKADQAMRYLVENSSDRQDPLIAPIGTIYDQSEIVTNKKGLRTSWTRPSLFSVAGLELRVGLDLVEDTAEQRLALTNRVWVPPMEYKSRAPWMQLSWDVGPLTFSGGIRREDGELHVDDYTTTWFRDRRFVKGGTLDYQENLVNGGVVWRINEGFSVFGSYGEGFTLANVGIPLRNIQCSNDNPDGTQPDGCPNDPQISVGDLLDLNAIVVDNTEFGFNWRGSRGSLSASHYDSKSDFGQSLSIDPITNDFVLLRAPVRIKGYELAGDYRFSEAWKFSAVYSHTRGKTSFWSADAAGRYPAGGLNRPMGVLDINPDKFAWSVTWNFVPHGDITLGATTLFSRKLSGTDVRAFDGQNFSFTEKTNGYTLFDLGMNYETERWGRFSLGIENLLDKQYILSWSQPPGGFQNYWAGRGRMVSLTHTIKF